MCGVDEYETQSRALFVDQSPSLLLHLLHQLSGEKHKRDVVKHAPTDMNSNSDTCTADFDFAVCVQR